MKELLSSYVAQNNLDLVLEVYCFVLRKSSTIPDSQTSTMWVNERAGLDAIVLIRATRTNLQNARFDLKRFTVSLDMALIKPS